MQKNSWCVIRFNGLPCHFQERTGARGMAGICISLVFVRLPLL